MLTHLIACLLCVAGPGEVPPFAAAALEGPKDLVTLDGATWLLVDDGALAAVIEAADVVAEVGADESAFLLVGSGGAAIEAAVLSTIVTSAPPLSPPDFAGTHPAPAKDVYHLRKTVETTKGPKEVYKDLVVERRSGESGSDFNKRSERELRDAMDAGWESVP